MNNVINFHHHHHYNLPREQQFGELSEQAVAAAGMGHPRQNDPN